MVDVRSEATFPSTPAHTLEDAWFNSVYSSQGEKEMGGEGEGEKGGTRKLEGKEKRKGRGRGSERRK